MSRVNTSQLCIICILTSFISTFAHAGGMSLGNSKPSATSPHITHNRPWGNTEAPRPAPMYQPQPPLHSYYPGAAPNTGWYPASLAVNSPATVALPTVEVDVEGSVFYEQQNIIYTVHVVSDANLKTLKPELPRIEGAALEQLDGPTVSTRMSNGGKRKIINSYRYRLMPLRSGEIVIPAIRFAGTHAQGRQPGRAPGIPAAIPVSSFNIAADAALTLQIQPADPAVTPWLPLHELKLQADLLQSGSAKAGEPVTLILELNAKGALGNQLPSLLRQLESTHYRIYQDATAIKNSVSVNGDYMTGSRRETYTIIPLEDGRIRLPEVSLAWWNVDTHSAMLARLPFGHTETTAAGNRATALSSAHQPRFPIYFWAPMVITLCLLAGFWLGAWPRTRQLFISAAGWLSARGQNALQYVYRVAIKLSPASLLRRLRMGLAVLMPRSIKLWICTRCLHAEGDPDAWCTEFKSRMCEHLNLPVHTPLTHIAEKIIAANPQAEPSRVRALVHSLEGAIYGGSSLDFPVWKRELTQQLRPHLLRRRRSKIRQKKATLPALNPRSV